MIDFNSLKKYDLAEFLRKAYNFKDSPGSSRNSPKLEGFGYTIVIRKNQDGNYTWFNINGDEKGKTILDIVSQLENCSLYHAAEIINTFLKTNSLNINPHPFSSSNNSNSSPSISFKELLYLFDTNSKLAWYRLEKLGIHPLSDTTFFNKRGISSDVISEFNSFSFPFIFNSVNKFSGKADNIAFILKPFDTDNPISFSIRNQGFKSFQGGHSDYLLYSNLDEVKNVKHLFIGESMIDCLSHFQLYKNDLGLSLKNTVYISTEGSLTDNHVSMINSILSNPDINLKSLNLIFDNDMAGHYFRLKLLSKLQLGKYDSPDYASYNRIYSASYRYCNSISDVNISFTPKLPFSSVTLFPTSKNEIENICMFLTSLLYEKSKLQDGFTFIPSFSFSKERKNTKESASFLVPNSDVAWKILSDSFLEFRFSNSIINSVTPIGLFKDFNELLLNEAKKNNKNLSI